MADKNYFWVSDVASGGVNTKDDPRELNDNESPYILNMDIKNKGRVICRTGYELWGTVAGVNAGGRGLLPYSRTYDDNSAIDNSADLNGAYANTYALQTSVNEGATHRKTFTPSSSDKGRIIRIGVWVVAKGTGNWRLILHDASNNVLDSTLITNANLTNGQINYFTALYTWTSGPLHFHVISTVADGTLKADTANDLETATYAEIYSTKNNYLISFFGDGKAYYSTASSPTPVEISSYGTDSGAVRGIQFNNYAIYGNGYIDNSTQKWNGTGVSTAIAEAPNTTVFGHINHSLMGVDKSSPTVLQWSDIDDEEDWSGGIASNTAVAIGNGEDITWIGTVNDTPLVLKERSIYPVEISFSATDVLERFSFKERKNSSSGCIATGSATPVSNAQGESLYYLSENGFEAYGVVENISNLNNPNAISYKINPTVKRVNFQYVDQINSEQFNDRYICITPFQSSQTNDYAFVRSLEFGAWTIYNGMNFADIKRFRDENERDMLIAQSASEAKLFKFNGNFSDNGFGYERIFQSKTFTFGRRVKWEWLDLVGSKTIGSTIFIQIDVDGRTELYKITDQHLTRGAGGGYIGDNWIGDSYLGGGFPGDATPLYNWKVRVQIKNIQYGDEFKFKVYNNADGEGWSMRGYGYKVNYLNDEVATTSNENSIPYAIPYS